MKKIKPLMDALEAYKHHYDNEGADYSATDLLQPPRITLLKKRHAEEILAMPVDPKKQLDSFWGTGIHNMFEFNLKGYSNYILEKRMSLTIAGKYITGCPDIVSKPDKKIYDIKQTKVWKKVFSDLHEWEEQLNIYAYMYHLKGVTIRELAIIAWWKNWILKDAIENTKYPNNQIEELPMKLWTPKKQEEWIYRAVKACADAEIFPDDQLPKCTREDRWEKASQYACYQFMKNGKRNKKASRVMYSERDIMRWVKKMLDPKTKYEIEVRPGGRERCDNWCTCRDWCSQYKEYMEEKRND